MVVLIVPFGLLFTQTLCLSKDFFSSTLLSKSGRDLIGDLFCKRIGLCFPLPQKEILATSSGSTVGPILPICLGDRRFLTCPAKYKAGATVNF